MMQNFSGIEVLLICAAVYTAPNLTPSSRNQLATVALSLAVLAFFIEVLLRSVK